MPLVKDARIESDGVGQEVSKSSQRHLAICRGEKPMKVSKKLYLTVIMNI